MSDGLSYYGYLRDYGVPEAVAAQKRALADWEARSGERLRWVYEDSAGKYYWHTPRRYHFVRLMRDCEPGDTVVIAACQATFSSWRDVRRTSYALRRKRIRLRVADIYEGKLDLTSRVGKALLRHDFPYRDIRGDDESVHLLQRSMLRFGPVVGHACRSSHRIPWHVRDPQLWRRLRHIYVRRRWGEAMTGISERRKIASFTFGMYIRLVKETGLE